MHEITAKFGIKILSVTKTDSAFVAEQAYNELVSKYAGKALIEWRKNGHFFRGQKIKFRIINA